MAVVDYISGTGGLQSSIDRVRGLFVRHKVGRNANHALPRVEYEAKKKPYENLLKSELEELGEMARIRAALYDPLDC